MRKWIGLGVGVVVILIVGALLIRDASYRTPLNLSNATEQDRLEAERILSQADFMKIYRERQDVDDYEDIVDDPKERIALVPTGFMDHIKYNSGLGLWKGGCPAVIHLQDGEVVRAKISVYGHFFVVEGIKGFFEIEDSGKEEWEKYYRGS